MKFVVEITGEDTAIRAAAALDPLGLKLVPMAVAPLHSVTPRAPRRATTAQASRQKKVAPSRADRSALLESVRQAITLTDGSKGKIVAHVRTASRGQVERALKALREQGAAHMAGEKTFARWGSTKEEATTRSAGAGAGRSVEQAPAPAPTPKPKRSRSSRKSAS